MSSSSSAVMSAPGPKPRAHTGRLHAIALAALSTAAFATCAALAAPAHAAFGLIQLQSVGRFEQFQEAGEPAISGNGEYLAFTGTLDGMSGVWRKNLKQGGAPQLLASGATAPSISETGQYVSFTSETAYVTQAQPGSNVYVRNMAIEPAYSGPCTQAQEAEGSCPYELASAMNGGTEGITYSGGGAIASGRISLSADGRKIAFVIEGSSNLTGQPGAPGTPTPGGQVAVRDLESDQTILVSAEREESGAMSARPVAGGAVTPSVQMGIGQTYVAPGAALSADGSTVAWLGANIPAQVPTLVGERQEIEADDAHAEEDQAYDEPLWRRIEDGPTAPTRRIVGGGDPLAPNCPPQGTIEIPACRGPYPRLAWEGGRGGAEKYYGWLGIQAYNGTPRLSADGWTVALIGDPDSTANVFVADMHEGLDRVQALRELTPEVPVPQTSNPGTRPEYVTTAGDVYEVAISPDGKRIAFTTQRQLFPLAPLSYAEEPPAKLGVVELYQILDEATLQRITHGPRDGPSLEGASTIFIADHGASSTSYTADGRTIAFADTASNLVYGDVNGASDVFTATDDEAGGGAAAVEVGGSPPGLEPAVAQWRLSVVAVTHRDGSMTLDIVVPSAGRVNASAAASVPIAASGRSSRRRPRSAAARRGAAAHRQTAAPGNRVVATAQMSATVPGLLELPLRVAAPYARLLDTQAGIYATVHVTFSGAGGPPLAQTLVVALRRGAGNTTSTIARRGGAHRKHNDRKHRGSGRDAKQKRSAR